MPITRSLAMIVALSAALATVTLGGCSTSSGNAASSDNINYVATGGGVVTTYGLGHRKAAPAVSGTDLDGKPLDLAQFKGQVVVLNFWASWCPPCRAEAPALQAVSSATKSLGVQFVGVDIRENGPDDGPNFVAAKGIEYPSFADPSARIALAFRDTGIPPETPPSTLVIDRTGHIAARGLGEMRVDQLKSVVEDVAKETS